MLTDVGPANAENRNTVMVVRPSKTQHIIKKEKWHLLFAAPTG